MQLWLSMALVKIASLSDPDTDVARTIAKLNALSLAFLQKADRLTVRKNQVFEIQRERLASRLLGEQRGQLTYIVGLELADHLQYDVAVRDALYLEHWPSPGTKEFPGQHAPT